MDFDATPVTAHSEKEGPAGTFNGGFGFRLLVGYLDESGEALAGILGPGDAGADHIGGLRQALVQLPQQARVMEILARADPRLVQRHTRCA